MKKLTQRDIRNMALIFTDRLLEEIGLNKLIETARRNAHEKHKDVCHSHDFCDANMMMHATFMDYLNINMAAPETLQNDQMAAAWTIVWDKANAMWLERFYL